MRIVFVFSAIALLGLTGCQSAPTAHPLPDACFEEPDEGNCRAAIPAFYYDSDADRCESFTWGGCEGNVPFETRDECMSSCYAPAPAPVNNTDIND